MPNWCLNEEIIYGPTKQIKELYEKMTNWLSTKAALDNPGWLGWIGIGAGMSIDSNDENNPETKSKYFYPRGSFLEMPEMGQYDSDTSAIRFASETAWDSIYDSWDRLLAIHAPLCRYYFMSVEPGNGVYLRRDPMRVLQDGDYYLDSYIYDEDTCPEELEEVAGDELYWYTDDVKQFLQKLLKSNSDNVEDLVAEFNAKETWGNDNYFAFNKIDDIE